MPSFFIHVRGLFDDILNVDQLRFRLMVADAFSENIVAPVRILEAPGSGALDKTAWECMAPSLF
jgi:hypothetical protein